MITWWFLCRFIPGKPTPEASTIRVGRSGGDPPVAPGLTEFTVAPCDPYTAQGEAFAQAVGEGVTGPVPLDDGAGNMRVIEQVLAAGARPTG